MVDLNSLGSYKVITPLKLTAVDESIKKIILKYLNY